MTRVMKSVRANLIQRNAFGVFIFMAVALFLAIASPQQAHAGGAVGGGGSGSDASGGHQSKYGYGWYIYDISSSGPENGFRSGMSWSTAQNSCRPYSTQIAVFIVLNSRGQAKGYNYEGWTSVKTGGNYISVAAAKAAFLAIDPADRAGYTWGTNVGWFCYGSKPTNWDASGTSSANRATATIGDTIKFSHNIKNNGNRPVVSSDNLDWRTVGYRVSGGVKGSEFNVSSGKINNLADGATVEASVQDLLLDSSMGLKAGDQLCHYITFPDRQDQRDPWEKSTPACVLITSSYDLYPKVTIPTSVILPGAEQSVTQNVINNSSMAPDRLSPYDVYEFVIKKGQPKPTTADLSPSTGTFNLQKTVRSQVVQYVEATISSTSCNWVRSNAAGFSAISTSPDCKLLSHGEGDFKNADNLITDPPIIADDYSIGDLVCRMVSVGYYKTGSLSASDRRISKPICVTIAKAPAVQIWGNDVKVGNSIYPAGKPNGPRNSASVYTKFVSVGTDKYGSWAEYGIFAPSTGVIRSVSGGAIASAPAKPLSFANTTSPDAGQWSSAQTIRSIVDALPVLPQGKNASGTININEDLNNDLPDGQWYKVTNDRDSVTIKDPPNNGYDTSRGTMVIDMTGGTGTKTVTISEDIILNRADDVAYTKLGEAVQVIIMVKGNIIIKSNVGRIDAWLVALPSTDSSNDGIISTCDEITTPYYKNLIVSGPCNDKQLVINGAVMAKQIQLRRTHGAEKPEYGKPAEIINLRADAYTWGSGTSSTGDGTGYPIRTIQTRELPPRL